MRGDLIEPNEIDTPIVNIIVGVLPFWIHWRCSNFVRTSETGPKIVRIAVKPLEMARILVHVCKVITCLLKFSPHWTLDKDLDPESHQFWPHFDRNGTTPNSQINIWKLPLAVAQRIQIYGFHNIKVTENTIWQRYGGKIKGFSDKNQKYGKTRRWRQKESHMVI